MGPVSKEFTARWKALGEAAQKKYNEKSAALKPKYEKDMEVWKKTKKYEEWQEAQKAKTEKLEKRDAKIAKKRAREEDVAAGAPKKAQSAWMLWNIAEGTPAVKKDKPGAGLPEISKAVGEMWKKMDAKAKEPWEKKAKKEKEVYDKANETFQAEKKARIEAEPKESGKKGSPKKGKGAKDALKAKQSGKMDKKSMKKSPGKSPKESGKESGKSPKESGKEKKSGGDGSCRQPGCGVTTGLSYGRCPEHKKGKEKAA